MHSARIRPSTLRNSSPRRPAFYPAAWLGVLLIILVSGGYYGANAASLPGAQAPAAVPNYAWEHQAPLPTGGTLNDLDMISANEGWAVGDAMGNGGVVIHTTDGGETWDYSTTGVEEPNYAVRFLSSTHGWTSSNNAVFRTTDGGRTWAESQGSVLAGSLYFLEFSTLNDGFAATGLDRGYYRTTDGGVTWQFRSMTRIIAGIQFFDADNGIASTETGIFHTSDRGNTWSFTPGHGGTFFLNHNLGWSVLENRSERTTDGGATWQPGAMPANAWVYDSVFLDAQNGWATGQGLQVLRTTDGGLTWNFQRQPNTYPYTNTAWAIDFGSLSKGILVGTGGVILGSSDGGASWQQRQNGCCGAARIFALDPNTAWAAAGAAIQWTTDGGQWWNKAALGDGTISSELRDIEFADYSNGWVTGGNGQVFRTTDGGRTWFQQFPNTRGYPMYGLDVINSQTVIVVGGSGPGGSGQVAERTTDGGATWHSVNARAGWQLTDVYFPTETVGYIVGWGSDGYGRISKSTDGGLTWTPQNAPTLLVLYQISFADENNGWTVGAGGEGGQLLHTSDGGATWVRQNSGIPGPEVLTAVDAVSPSIAWIASSSTIGPPHVRRTTDGGATWVEEPTGTNPYNWWNTIFFLTPDYGWVGGESVSEPRGGILRRVPVASTPTPTRTVVPVTPSSTPIPTSTSSTPAPSATPTTCTVPEVRTGSITFGDPSASQSIEYDNIQSTCEFPKTCPTTFEGTIHYDSYTFTNTTGTIACVTVTLDGTQCGFDIEGAFSRAYLGTFNPSNACLNYLADPGFYTDPFAGPITYNFNVPAGATFVVVVEAISEEQGCNSYVLTVEGHRGCTTSTPGPATSTAAPTQTSILPTLTIQPTLPATTPTTAATGVATVTTGSTTTAIPTSIPTSTGVAATPTSCSVAFSDVPSDHTFYGHVRCLSCRGIISGYADGTFRPNNNITRGQIAKMVSNAAGFTEPISGQSFEDVTAGSPFYEFVERLYRRGHMGGYPCGQRTTETCIAPENRPYFRPNENATRGQLSKIVANAAGFSEPMSGQYYADVAANNPFYTEVMRLTMRSAMSGYPCGGPGEPCDVENRPYFRWGNPVTRGQSSKIVANTFFAGCTP